jgi:DNA replication protein DnaC
MNETPQNIIDSILKQANPLNENVDDVKNAIKLPSKKELWANFKYHFFNLYGKKFIENNETIANVKTLFYYFLKDDKFFQCINLDKSSIPSFDKGLLIIGGFGIGKTAYMKVFEKCFDNFRPYRFKIFNTNDLVTMYEGCGNNNDKNAFSERMSSGRILFDDVNTEREANNFGKVDLLKEIIEKRYMANKLTHITCNYAEGYDGDIEETLLGYADRYGSRVHDRLFEMFNIITFSGKSLRR